MPSRRQYPPEPLYPKGMTHAIKINFDREHKGYWTGDVKDRFNRKSLLGIVEIVHHTGAGAGFSGRPRCTRYFLSAIGDISSKELCPVKEMEISTRDSKGINVVDISGEVDIYSGEELKQCLEGFANDSQPVLLNLSKTNYIDSFGLSLLISFRKKLGKQGKKFALCCPQSYVKRILNLTKLYEFLSVFENEESALSAFESSSGEASLELEPKISIQADERLI
jgi:anti-sigma B factor antagonist